MLSTTDHSRDAAGLTYVYPVLSRRAGGLSLGINLNPNNACNWRCVYCQVPELQRGSAPPVDLPRLKQELSGFLQSVRDGSFYDRFQVPQDQRVLRDIALSGNGEPTSAPHFDRVVETIGEVIATVGLPGDVKRVLISNGSLMRREAVQRALRLWNALGGEVWFKLDSGTEAGRWRINAVQLTSETVLANLEAAARLCPVWLQTCVFAFDGAPPAEDERGAYLAVLDTARARRIPLRGVLLYGLARPSLQAEASRLSPLPAEWMEAFAAEIGKSGLVVKLSL